MKIIKQNEHVTTKLKDIDFGAAFYYPDTGSFYMKTEGMFVDGKLIANAVNLRMGSLCTISLDEDVIAVDCECIVKEKEVK